VLGFFSACGFAPILMLLYSYYQNTKNLFATLFSFAIGVTISTLIFSIIPHFTNSLSFKFGGMVVFIVCVLLSLIGANAIHLQKITKINTKLAA
jgi:multisubunit Na+/H+ antiporter MnhE subunit